MLRKTVEIHGERLRKKYHLTECPLELLIDDWEQDYAQFFSHILSGLELKAQDMMMLTLTLKRRCKSA